MNERLPLPVNGSNLGKFENPDWTAKGEKRASVPLTGVKTLWFNTGTLCNIECVNCYIESSPSNDRLVYLTRDEVAAMLDQIPERNWPTTEIGFTGGEPFMNPAMIDILEASLTRGYDVLVLTNAMRPMMRPKMQKGILELNERFPGKLTFRISVDHYSAAKHDEERGEGSFEIGLKGMRWLRDHNVTMTVAGRTIWGDNDTESRDGYDKLFKSEDLEINAYDPAACVLFPEMDETAEVPEITTACWGILKKRPVDIMCATSRMVVKRKGSKAPTVVACTLLAYDEQFELGETLESAEKAIKLNHQHCAKFCVLGGASCSA